MRFRMTTLSRLKFVPAPTGGNPLVRKRERFCQRLEEQARVLDEPDATKSDRRYRKQPDGSRKLVETDVKIRSWAKPTGGSGYVFVPRINSRPVEFSDGRTGIAVESMEQLREVIDTLMTATRAGELDQFIAPAKAQLPEHIQAAKSAVKKRKAA
jgi:hypothetical protein